MNTRSITAICRGCLAVAVMLAATVMAAPAHAACNGNPSARVDPDNQTVPERTGGNFTVVTLDGSKSTPNNPELLFQWTYLGSTPAGLPVTLSSTSAQKPTFTSPNVPATGAALNFQLTVTCGTRTSSITTIVNVTDVLVNSPPTASFFISPLNATEGQTVTLDGTASSDPDGQSLTYGWTQIGGSPSVTLANGNAAGSIKTFLAPNLTATTTLTFRLTVSDGALSNSTDKSVSIVWTNDPPIAALTCPVGGVLVANEGQAVTFNAGASTDPEGGLLTYAWGQNMGLPNLGIGGLTTPSITFNTPHLGYQQLGGMTVTVTVTDNQNVSASKSCGLFIKDVTAPVIVVPNDITAEATSGAGANVPYSATSQDAVEDALPNPLACVPPSNSLFALDATTPVNCTGQDAAGNVSNVSFNIFVDDTTPPTLAVPGDTAVEAEDANGAIAHFTATNTDIVDGTAPAACTPATGSQFPLGDTTVNCTAVDAHANAAAPKSFVLSVMDTTAPTIAPHADVGPIEATSGAGAIATYTAPATHDAVDGDGIATCAPLSGSTFALGTTTVDCDAADAAGNDAATTHFNVTVVDTTAPVINPHADLGPIEATGPGGAIVDYGVIGTFDVVDVDLVATCSPASGSTFALGTTTVDCDAADAAGNDAATTHFNVTVVDTTPPTIDPHAAIVGIEATGPGGAAVVYTSPATHDLVDGIGTATCSPAPGSTFALGTTAVDCDAADAAGNDAATTHFNVTVVDTTAPVIAAHADVGPVEATGPGGAAIVYASPATSDAVDGAGVASCVPASGSTFALGTSLVSCHATDAAGNHAVSTMFNVTVRDSTPPVIAPHANLSAEATGPSGAAVSYASPATSDAVDGPGVASCAPASGSTFSLGANLVTCNATDAAGNHAASTTFTVTVRDTTPPAITPHADLVATATGNSSAVVNYALPTAADLVDGPVAVSCAPASNSTFNVGATTVTCSASDNHGNVATSTFTVNVSYVWSGFFSPVDNLPVWNKANAGSAIPLKFGLGGYQGMDIFAAGFPVSGTVACNSTATPDLIEETVNPGSSTLQYDAGTTRYHYVWKTNKAWAGTCRQLQIRLRDGSVHTANFTFPK